MDLDKPGTARDIQELLSLRSDLERLELSQDTRDGLSPRLDLLDLGDAYQIILEAPGVAQENLEVGLQGRSLLVAGFREPQQGALLVSERPSGPFQRSVELPGDVNERAGQAHLRDGLLVITLPKA